MPTATRTFRVFVSSTLEDLIEERNALQREVFPKLTKLREEHGARFLMRSTASGWLKKKRTKGLFWTETTRPMTKDPSSNGRTFTVN